MPTNRLDPQTLRVVRDAYEESHGEDFGAELHRLIEAAESPAPPPVGETPRQHGYGCTKGGPMSPDVNCVHCCRHGWVEPEQGKPCPECYPPILSPAPSPEKLPKRYHRVGNDMREAPDGGWVLYARIESVIARLQAERDALVQERDEAISSRDSYKAAWANLTDLRDAFVADAKATARRDAFAEAIQIVERAQGRSFIVPLVDILSALRAQQEASNG